MHGVGVGLLGYLPLILQLERATRDRPLFLVEMPYVAMRLWEHIPTPFETAELVHGMLARHAFQRAALVGHSFGSISVAWVRKMRPQIVDSIVLIDPVCLLLCWPKVAFNFVYKASRFNVTTPEFRFFDWLIAFCSSELSMARTMSRSDQSTIKCVHFLIPGFGVFVWLIDLHDECGSDTFGGTSTRCGPKNCRRKPPSSSPPRYANPRFESYACLMLVSLAHHPIYP